MPDGNIRSVADNIAHPNRLAITSSHDLLVAETLGNRLLRFKIDSDGEFLHRFRCSEGMSPLGIMLVHTSNTKSGEHIRPPLETSSRYCAKRITNGVIARTIPV